MTLLVMGGVLLVKRSRKIKKHRQRNIRDTMEILYQGNVSQKSHFDGEQQLHLANCYQRQSMTEYVADTARIGLFDMQQGATIYDEVFLSPSNSSRSHSNTQLHSEQDGANGSEVTSNPIYDVIQQQKHQVPLVASVISHSHSNTRQHAQQDDANRAEKTSDPTYDVIQVQKPQFSFSASIFPQSHSNIQQRAQPNVASGVEITSNPAYGVLQQQKYPSSLH